MSRSIETITVILMVLSCVLNILNITVIRKTAFFLRVLHLVVTLLSLKKVSSGEEKQKDMKEMR